MTLEEKLQNSEIISQKCVRASRYGLVTGKKRWFGLIVFIIMSLFTIFSKFINQGDKDSLTEEFLNYSLVCIALNMFFNLLLKFMNDSIFALNHNFVFRLTRFLGSLSKVLVFFFTMVAYINKVMTYWDDYVIKYALEHNMEVHESEFISWLIKFKYIDGIDNNFVWDFFYNEPLKHILTIVLCFVTIITFIPTLFYFIGVAFKALIAALVIYQLLIPFTLVFCLPIVHIIVLLKVLKRPRPSFRHIKPHPENKDLVIVERRRITGKVNRFAWFWKNFLMFLPATLLVIISADFYCMLIYISLKYGYGFDMAKIFETMSQSYSQYVPVMWIVNLVQENIK